MEELTKLEIAERQLHRAIRLHMEESDYVSAITLAGAAEEILGNMRKNQGDSPAVVQQAELALIVSESMNDGQESQATIKNFVNIANEARNELKHLNCNLPDELKTIVIAADNADDMLDRAVSNYLVVVGLKEGPVLDYLVDRDQRRRANQAVGDN